MSGQKTLLGSLPTRSYVPLNRTGTQIPTGSELLVLRTPYIMCQVRSPCTVDSIYSEYATPTSS